MKILTIDESIDAHDNEIMIDVVGKQVLLEQLKLPETTEHLEMIMSDTFFAIEFLTNIKQMQSTMNQLMSHQVVEERKSFTSKVKSSKMIASVVSQFASFAALIDVVAMMYSDCKAIFVMDYKGPSGGEFIGVAVGGLLLIAQVISTIAISCMHRS